MDKTAEEVLQGEDCVLNDRYMTRDVIKAMKEYARLAIEADRKQIASTLGDSFNMNEDIIIEHSNIQLL